MPINTKLVIADTLRAMARRKSIDKITVKALVEACGISRQTFYYHFQDILDVVEWSIQQALQRALRQSLEADTMEEAVRAFVDMAAEDRGQIGRLLQSQRREEFERIFLNGLETYLRELVRHKAPERPLGELDMETAIRFYACGIMGVLLRFAREQEPDAARMTRQLCALLERLAR